MDTYRQRFERLLQEMMEAVRALIGELAQKNVLVAESATLLRIDPSGLDVRARQDGREDSLFALKGHPPEVVRGAAQELAARLGKDCALDIASSLSVTSRMILPAESEDILSAIVRNKVESIAPWPLALSIYGKRVSPIADDPAHVEVEVGVVSRVLVDDIASTLSAAGTIVKSASLQLPGGERLRLDYGSREESREAQRRALVIASAVGVVAAGVAGVGMLLVIYSFLGLSGLRAETASLRASLAPEGAGGATSLVEAANLLYERRRQRLPAAAVLDDLSETLPQTVWLNAVSLDDQRIELKGQGSDIPSLIEVLEQSDSFSGVNFSSATQFNAELNAEVFSIEATLEPAKEAAP
jgi:general secretion pathway protein L